MLVSFLIVFIGMGVFSQVRVSAANVPASKPQLIISEPVSDIFADLQEFIPVQMELDGVPGLAIALIRDGKVIWADGFGVTNTLIGEPITADTVFEVASNSKVITAYTALRLVDQGFLSLDEPLDTYLSETWLPAGT